MLLSREIAVTCAMNVPSVLPVFWMEAGPSGSKYLIRIWSYISYRAVFCRAIFMVWWSFLSRLQTLSPTFLSLITILFSIYKYFGTTWSSVAAYFYASSKTNDELQRGKHGARWKGLAILSSRFPTGSRARGIYNASSIWGDTHCIQLSQHFYVGRSFFVEFA